MNVERRQSRSCTTIRFEGPFGLREAIALPALLRELPRRTTVVLDFADVRWTCEGAVMALIPALGSLHGRCIEVLGIDQAGVEPDVFSAAMA